MNISTAITMLGDGETIGKDALIKLLADSQQRIIDLHSELQVPRRHAEDALHHLGIACDSMSKNPDTSAFHLDLSIEKIKNILK